MSRLNAALIAADERKNLPMKPLLLSFALLSSQCASAAEPQVLLSLRQNAIGHVSSTSVYILSDGTVNRSHWDGQNPTNSMKFLSGRELSRIETALKLVAGKPLVRPTPGLTCAAVPTMTSVYEATTGETANGTEITIVAQGSTPCGGWDQIAGGDGQDLIDILNANLP